MKAVKHIEIYTDGACRGNPGVGGWGALLKYNGREKCLSGAVDHTTNNRMELLAAIMALQALKEPCVVDLYTDSQYVQKGISQWLKEWKAQNWLRSGKEPVKNMDLWQALDNEAMRHQVVWHWVRGHNGHPGNERADELANLAIDAFLKGDDKGQEA